MSGSGQASRIGAEGERSRGSNLAAEGAFRGSVAGSEGEAAEHATSAGQRVPQNSPDPTPPLAPLPHFGIGWRAVAPRFPPLSRSPFPSPWVRGQVPEATRYLEEPAAAMNGRGWQPPLPGIRASERMTAGAEYLRAPGEGLPYYSESPAAAATGPLQWQREVGLRARPGWPSVQREGRRSWDSAGAERRGQLQREEELREEAALRELAQRAANLRVRDQEGRDPEVGSETCRHRGPGRTGPGAVAMRLNVPENYGPPRRPRSMPTPGGSPSDSSDPDTRGRPHSDLGPARGRQALMPPAWGGGQGHIAPGDPPVHPPLPRRHAEDPPRWYLQPPLWWSQPPPGKGATGDGGGAERTPTEVGQRRPELHAGYLNRVRHNKLEERQRGREIEVVHRSSPQTWRVLQYQDTPISTRPVSMAGMKVEVSLPFTGNQEVGPRLDEYLSVLDSQRDKWEAAQQDMRVFFRLLAPTMRGSAAAVYRDRREALLEAVEEDGEAYPVIDRNGQAIPLLDPAYVFVQELALQFPSSSAERHREYDLFKRRRNETARQLYDRLRRQAEDVEEERERTLVDKFLGSLQEDVASPLRQVLVTTPSRSITLLFTYQQLEMIERNLVHLKCTRKEEPREHRRVQWAEGGTWKAGKEKAAAGTETSPRDRRDTRHPRPRGGGFYLCDAVGHLYRSCTQFDPKKPCTKCGTPGHISQVCSEPEKGKDRRGRERGAAGWEEEYMEEREPEGDGESEDCQETPEEDVDLSDDEVRGNMAQEAGGGNRWPRGFQAMTAEEATEVRDLVRVQRRLRTEQATQLWRDLQLLSMSPKDRAVEKTALEETLQQLEDDVEPVMRATPAGSASGDAEVQWSRLQSRTGALELKMDGPTLLTVEGLAPRLSVILDTGASAVLMGRRPARRLGLDAGAVGGMCPKIQGAGEGYVVTVGVTKQVMRFLLRPGSRDTTEIALRVILIDTDAYNLLLGMEFLRPLGIVIDCRNDAVTYRKDWETEGTQAVDLPVVCQRPGRPSTRMEEALRRVAIGNGVTEPVLLVLGEDNEDGYIGEWARMAQTGGDEDDGSTDESTCEVARRTPIPNVRPGRTPRWELEDSEDEEEAEGDEQPEAGEERYQSTEEGQEAPAHAMATAPGVRTEASVPLEAGRVREVGESSRTIRSGSGGAIDRRSPETDSRGEEAQTGNLHEEAESRWLREFRTRQQRGREIPQGVTHAPPAGEGGRGDTAAETATAAVGGEAVPERHAARGMAPAAEGSEGGQDGQATRRPPVSESTWSRSLRTSQQLVESAEELKAARQEEAQRRVGIEKMRRQRRATWLGRLLVGWRQAKEKGLQEGQPHQEKGQLWPDPGPLDTTARRLWLGCGRTANEGITLVELFAGISTGLAAAVEAGWRIKRYVYVEIDPKAKAVAKARAERLSQANPELLAPGVVEEAFRGHPMDIQKLDARWQRDIGHVHLVMAGWECQGLSRAGKGKGLADARSGLLRELVRVLLLLQEAQRRRPPAYIVENVDVKGDGREGIQGDWEVMRFYLGEGVVAEAARLGSAARRHRRYWTNLLPADVLEGTLQTLTLPRPSAQALVEAGVELAPVLTDEPFNQRGEPRQVWPCLVSRPASYAFRIREGRVGGGMVKEAGEWRELNITERERAMGLPVGETRAPRTTEEERRVLLGRSFDLNTLVALCQLAEAYRATPVLEWEQKCSHVTVEVALNQSQWRGWAAQHAREWDNDGTWAAAEESLSQFHQMPEEGDTGQGDEEDPAVWQTCSWEWSEVAAAADDTTRGAGGELEPDEGVEWKVHGGTDQETREKLRTLIRRMRACFAYTVQDLHIPCTAATCTLELKTEVPIFRRARRLSHAEQAAAREQLKGLEDASKIITTSTSSYGCPLTMPPKKDENGEWTLYRLCCDFRALNAATNPIRYPMTLPEEIFDKMKGCRVYSKLDLRSGFHQISIAPADRHKTAFHGVDGKFFEWARMPFGLVNASAVFQAAMDKVLRGLSFACCYIDDIIIFSSSVVEHLEHLEEVFQRLQKHALRCHPGKCVFMAPEIEYLGHQVGPNGIHPAEAKVTAITGLASPTNRTEVRMVLGLLSYYRRFIPRFSERAFALTQLTSEKKAWKRGPAEEEAFADLKRAMSTAPVLQLPTPGEPYALYTDWSCRGVGAVLTQGTGEEERPVAYASKSCNEAQAQYTAYEGECLAAVWAVRHFRVYLHGARFRLITDHQPLKWLMETSELRGKLARWALILQEYVFDVEYREGRAQTHVDALSRHRQKGAAQTVDEKGEIEEPQEVFLATSTQEEEEYQALLQLAQSNKQGEWQWDGTHLWRCQKGTKTWVVPPQEREAHTMHQLATLGHFGAARTTALVQTGAWWPRLATDVRRWVQGCEHCDRVKARREAAEEELHSLPLRGLGYRWGLDYTGELPTSTNGNKVILVMIEYGSKWVKAVPLPQKGSAYTSRHFMAQVVSRFGACAEVVTDQGTEFQGEFTRLLEQLQIRHRVGSRYHPQSNGLAERMMQTLKASLRKYSLSKGGKAEWDKWLYWFLLGYRLSPQAALGSFAPYTLLYGRQPLVPGVPEGVWGQDVTASLDDVAGWGRAVAARAKWFQLALPAALENLQTAQERDARRHAARHADAHGGHRRQQGFRRGDYVYLYRRPLDGLEADKQEIILQVAEVQPRGILLLRGRGRSDGIVSEHMSNVAHCMLPRVGVSLSMRRTDRQLTSVHRAGEPQDTLPQLSPAAGLAPAPALSLPQPSPVGPHRLSRCSRQLSHTAPAASTAPMLTPPTGLDTSSPRTPRSPKRTMGALAPSTGEARVCHPIAVLPSATQGEKAPQPRAKGPHSRGPQGSRAIHPAATGPRLRTQRAMQRRQLQD